MWKLYSEDKEYITNLQKVLFVEEANSREEMELVFKLRYKCYLRDGYIQPNRDEKFFDEYDSMPHCVSYLLYLEGKAIGTIRTCLFLPENQNEFNLPIFSAYPTEMLAFKDKRLLELNKFVLDLPKGKSDKNIVMFLFNQIWKSGIADNIDFLVAGISKSHYPFYRFFKFQRYTKEERSYPGLSFKTILVACDFVDGNRKYVQENQSNETLKILMYG